MADYFLLRELGTVNWTSPETGFPKEPALSLAPVSTGNPTHLPPHLPLPQLHLSPLHLDAAADADTAAAHQGTGRSVPRSAAPRLVLTLVPYPALVAEAGGVDTAAREAGGAPVARLGLGHLGVEHQVDKSVAKQPAGGIQQPGGGAPAPAGPDSPHGGGRELRRPRLHHRPPADPKAPQEDSGRGAPEAAAAAAAAAAAEAAWAEEAVAAVAVAVAVFTGAGPRPAPPEGRMELRYRRRLRSAPPSPARASPPLPPVPLRLVTLASPGRPYDRYPSSERKECTGWQAEGTAAVRHRAFTGDQLGGLGAGERGAGRESPALGAPPCPPRPANSLAPDGGGGRGGRGDPTGEASKGGSWMMERRGLTLNSRSNWRASPQQPFSRSSN
ncbi:uncharacterized protein ACOB8E_010084 [Sarcophilus harrisii]